MKQWNVYYVVLAIDFYIPGRRIYWKTAILKRDVEKKKLTDKFWEEGI